MRPFAVRKSMFVARGFIRVFSPVLLEVCRILPEPSRNNEREDELEAQGIRNWNSAVEAFRIIKGAKFTTTSGRPPRTATRWTSRTTGRLNGIALSNNNNVWASVFSVLLSDDWGADEALLAIRVMGELPALGIIQLGPALCICHTHQPALGQRPCIHQWRPHDSHRHIGASSTRSACRRYRTTTKGRSPHRNTCPRLRRRRSHRP